MRCVSCLIEIGLLCWGAAASAAAGAEIRLAPLIGQGLEMPVHAATAPGQPDRLYIVEQAGRIRILQKGKLLPDVFLDIAAKVVSGGEMGLLSIAFHPKFAENGRFFVNYTEQAPRLKTVIAEYSAQTKQERRILVFDQPYANHNGGHLLFDSKGYLIVGNGDGGSAGDPGNRAQDKSTLLGKILRLDIDRAFPYAIPPDNPFQKKAERPEIYAYGVRNPWRLAIDRATGKLWAADVGQYDYEEIDIIEKGGNYGWPKREGKHCFRPKKKCEEADFIDPIWEYDHSQGVSITGGYVYRGKALTTLIGKYVYGDYGSGKIWALSWDGKKAQNVLLLESQEPISSFAEDASGEILVVSHRGKIFRLVSAAEQ